MTQVEPTIGDALIWAGLDKAQLSDDKSDINSLLLHLGQSVDHTFEFAELDEWKTNGVRPKMG